ncbi:MAG: bifunctional (p)ppGpp synthetase/guanosine-3',5'-bis(diphosphate) 3'-pyrophosphohydrolase [bacterium]|nr:bifunctional (p)ppGpp synthetase/guanosine-3',5'-bis(diphosphate) 3'-pyrophosphohydrolase [bacterium]
MDIDIEKVIEQVKSYNPETDFELIRKAHRVAAEAHEGQERLSGGPFISHPLWVAYILAELKLDAVTIAAGLLHDVVEDTSVDSDKIKKQFGDEVAVLVDGVTKLRDIARQSRETRRVENLRKMLVAMAADIRVILIKMADRLHNMCTLGSLTRNHQIRVAHETQEIYAPLAHRLGMGRIKAELEDLALLYLEPEIYKEIKENVAADKKRQEVYIEEARKLLEEKLKETGIKATVTGRSKHYYSIYRKMVSQHKKFEEIYDLFALRVITKSVKDCYVALGIVHAVWKARPGRFKDYINIPKTNMYKAIHTTVMGPNHQLMEVQIKTEEMHRVAEYGVAAHWRYKEGKPGDAEFDKDLVEWSRRIVQEELGDEHDFMDGIMGGLFTDEVFIFTPKGEIRALPRGSSPIDFAYSIHTAVGNHCLGARVNNRIVPLRYKLVSGDIVEILTAPRAHPSQDWLNIVKTPRARGRIRQWFRLKVEEEQGGEKPLHKEEVGKEARAPLPLLPAKRRQRPSSTGVMVSGLLDMDVHFARCCNPVPGDKIIGYVSQGRGISVHRKGCTNILGLPGISQRSVSVSWDQDSAASFEAGITVDAHDRSKLMADMLAAISNTQTIINAADAKKEKSGMAKCHFTVLINNQEKLETIIKVLEAVHGVVRTYRTKPI